MEIPEDLKEKAAQYEDLIELAVEEDDDLMESYLEGNEPSIEDLKDAFERERLISTSSLLLRFSFKNKVCKIS